MASNNIYIFGGIGDEVTASSVMRQLSLVKDDSLNVFINSNGGSVSEGFAIYDLLVRSGKSITVEIVGMCASIATVIAFAGKARKMSSNAQFMIHNPWGGVSGEADDFEKMAKRMREHEDRMAKFYAERVNIDIEKVKEMMKVETFMSAENALEMGFITEILEPIIACTYDFKDELKDIKKGNVMNEIKEGINQILAKLKIIGSNKEQEVVAYELALESGQILESKMPQDSNRPTIGDLVSIQNQTEAILDGEYVVDSTSDILKVEGGKIVDILHKTDEIEAKMKVIINPVLNGVEQIANHVSVQFSTLEDIVNASLTRIDSLEAKSNELETLNDSLKQENEALKAELTEFKATVGSTYTPPASNEIETKTDEKYTGSSISAKMREIENRARDNK